MPDPEDLLMSDDPATLDDSGVPEKYQPQADPDADATDFNLGGDDQPEGGDQPSPAPQTPAEYFPGDATLADEARRYGIQNFAAFGNDNALRAAVEAQRQAFYQYQQHYQRQQQQWAQQQQQRPQQPVQLPQWKNPLGNLEELDPALAKMLPQAFDSLHQHYQGILGPTFQALQNLHNQQQQVMQHVQSIQDQARQAEYNRTVEAMYSKADSAVSALPKEYEQFVGMGDVKGEARDPRFQQVQDNLIRSAYAMAHAKGKNPESMSQSDWNGFMKKAADAEFSEHVKSLARQGIEQGLRKRQSAIQPRQNTTARRVERDGEHSNAVAFLKEKLRT